MPVELLGGDSVELLVKRDGAPGARSQEKRTSGKAGYARTNGNWECVKADMSEAGFLFTVLNGITQALPTVGGNFYFCTSALDSSVNLNGI